jgi:uncharacterized lipoprotein YddW (UPF0748 family)
VLASAQHSREFVDLCADSGINTLFVVVWNRGATVYPSPLMEREFGVRCDPRYEGRDALQEIITAAHARGLRVFAWFEFGFASSYGEADGGRILRARPHWAARDSAGSIVSKNNFQWMNAFHPEVQEFMLALMREVVDNYAVDGIQGDDRLPANPSTAGYDDWTTALYAKQHNGRRPPADYRDANWIKWRANRLNQFAARMYRELKAAEPSLVVASAPSIFPWSEQEYLQDWPTWLAEGSVDVVSPQIYRDSIESYQHELTKIATSQVAPDKRARVFPGILLRTADGFQAADDMLEKMISENRRQGFAGEILFYDAAVTENAATLERLYRPHTADRTKP